MEANRIEERKNICATWFNNLLRSFPAGGGEKSGACREMFRIY